MKRILFLLTFACVAMFAACEYDDSALIDRMDGFESRLERLEELCAQMNTNISSLQTIVNALQQKDFISTIAPINKDGKEVGYTITFSSGKAITIYHGNDGKDGEDGIDGKTPQIGVKQDADGVYYWTVDGEWLTDAAGAKIQAAAEDGTDGKDGTTPQLKIEDDYWYVSYDNGTTWTKLGKATGEDGSDGSDGSSDDNIFQSVTQDSENVYFVLTDGTRITIPKSASMENIVLTYIPRYSDGKATVFYATKEDSYVELDFEVSPVSAAQQIASNWQSWATVKAVYTETRAAVSLIDMPIISCTADSQAGIITVKASGKNLSDDFFAGAEDASARLSITVDNAKYTSDYVPMVAKNMIAQPNNEIWYTSSGNTVDPNDVSVFDANIVSNTYEKGKGVIKFDGNITVVGDWAFYGCKSLTSITIPDSVTRIGEYAFRDCSNLKSITIPDSVTEVGYGSFLDCSSLTNVTIPNSVTTIGVSAFEGCSSLTSITIPDSVTEIGYCAFWGCSSLTSITIPDSVTEIGHSAFKYCSSLTSITIPNSVTEIGAWAFDGCTSLTNITIPNSVTTIGEGAFSWCTSLTNITIPNSVMTIGSLAFLHCTSLTNITIPNSVTKINHSTFNCCSSLTNITIPNSVTIIENGAFLDCTSLTNITIPDSVTTIEECAFYGCSSLKAFYGKFASEDKRALIVDDILNSFAIGCGATSYTIPDSVTEIGSSAFYNCSSLTNITIPDSVMSIGNSAFSQCTSLTNITIPNSVTTIGGWAFSYCSSLTNITIPDSVTEIEFAAFYSCLSLTNITIGNSVTTIGYYAFVGCTSLTNIYCTSTIPPTATLDSGVWDAFKSIGTSAKIYVPIGSGNAYKTASYWSEYASIIEEKAM